MAVRVRRDSGPQASWRRVAVSGGERQEKGVARGNTHDGDCLDADGEDVEGEVARVREGVFLPELGEEGVHASDVMPVQDVVPLEGDV